MATCNEWHIENSKNHKKVISLTIKSPNCQCAVEWYHVTIGLSIFGFLLVHWNHASILHHYGDIGPQRYWGHDLDLLGSRDVIGHVTIRLGICGFLLVVHWNHAPLRRYKASKLHLPTLKAKSSLRMLRVTWPVGRGSKIATYLEFLGLHCLFTIQLVWGYYVD